MRKESAFRGFLQLVWSTFEAICPVLFNTLLQICYSYHRGADKSLARPGRKLGSMSGTRAISTTSRREPTSFFFPARQGAEGNFTPF